MKTFRPTYGRQLSQGEQRKFYFVILPALTITKPMDKDVWYYENGAHWIDKKMLECPRIHDDKKCPICEVLRGSVGNADLRKYWANFRYAVNAYFFKWKNPPGVADTVQFYNMPKTLFEIIYKGMEDSPWPLLPVGIVKLRMEWWQNWPRYDGSSFEPIKRELYDKILTNKVMLARRPLENHFEARNFSLLNEWANAISNEVVINAMDMFTGPTFGLTGVVSKPFGSGPSESAGFVPLTGFPEPSDKPKSKPVPELGKRKLDI
jgi:hypothetical protein